MSSGWLIEDFFLNTNLVLISMRVYTFTNTRRHTPLRRLTSSSCIELRPLAKAFFALRAKQLIFMLFVLTLGNFCCSVVTSVIFVITFITLKKAKKSQKKISKSCIRETPTLTTDADSRADTILERLRDLPIRTEKPTWSTQKCGLGPR